MKIIRTNQPQKDQRRLKVYKKYTRFAGGHHQVPEIRLLGKWLEKIGFKCGQEISVIQYDNTLIISNGKGKGLVF